MVVDRGLIDELFVSSSLDIDMVAEDAEIVVYLVGPECIDAVRFNVYFFRSLS